jgi:RND family efflux transporter MFP subunit
MKINRPIRLISLASVCAAFAASHAHADEPVVAVQTATVQRGTIAQPVRAYGVVEASAANLATVNLPYVARIVEMRVQGGQTVARGTPLFVVQADPAAALAATQAKSAVTLAGGELARTQSLFDKNLATASQLAAAKKAEQDAQQALAAQSSTGIVAGNKTVVATVDGVVLQVQANPGDQIQAGASILQIARATNVHDARGNVVLGIEPADAQRVHPGDSVTLHGLSTALSHQSAVGRVLLVGASIDPQTQLVDISANVPLGATPFLPGTHVSADIATAENVHWIVPRAAVLKDAHGEYVFQITPAKKARRVAVVTKIEDNDRYGIDGPLDASQPLVVTGNYELKDGGAVQTSGGAPR